MALVLVLMLVLVLVQQLVLVLAGNLLSSQNHCPVLF
jgi:hypothetical protein